MATWTPEQQALIQRIRRAGQEYEELRELSIAAVRACLDRPAEDCTAEPCGGRLIVQRVGWIPGLPRDHRDAHLIPEDGWQFVGRWEAWAECDRCGRTSGKQAAAAVGSDIGECRRRWHEGQLELLEAHRRSAEATA